MNAVYEQTARHFLAVYAIHCTKWSVSSQVSCRSNGVYSSIRAENPQVVEACASADPALPLQPSAAALEPSIAAGFCTKLLSLHVAAGAI